MDSAAAYIQEVKEVLLKEYSSPSAELIDFFANHVCSSFPPQQVIDRFAPIIKEAFRQFINDHTGNRLTMTENAAGKPDHIISDEEFEGFFVVNVT